VFRLALGLRSARAGCAAAAGRGGAQAASRVAIASRLAIIARAPSAIATPPRAAPTPIDPPKPVAPPVPPSVGAPQTPSGSGVSAAPETRGYGPRRNPEQHGDLQHRDAFQLREHENGASVEGEGVECLVEQGAAAERPPDEVAVLVDDRPKPFGPGRCRPGTAARRYFSGRIMWWRLCDKKFCGSCASFANHSYQCPDCQFDLKPIGSPAPY
jgi:hypothetical protein